MGVIHLQQNLTDLRERLSELAGTRARSHEDETGHAWSWQGNKEDAGWRHRSNPAGGFGRVYRRVPTMARSADLVIPPRARPGQQGITHTVLETGELTTVRVIFPIAVHVTDIKWEVDGDVLEIEYVGQALGYHHAFIVPKGTMPRVDHSGRSVVFSFAKETQGPSFADPRR